MMKRPWLFGLLLALPLFALGASEAIQVYDNVRLRAQVSAEYPDADPAKIRAVTVDTVCAMSEFASDQYCATRGALDLVSRVAVWTAMAGVGLLVLIHAAGALARTSRGLLLAFFKPGLYLTLATLISLTIAQALLGVLTIYFGGAALLGVIPSGLIAAVVIGAGAAVLAMARGAFTLVRRIETGVVGWSLSRDQAPRLWEVVDQVAARLHALVPDHLVVGLDPNFFATEAEVVCLNGRLKGRTLFCSLPLSRILTKAELTAIVGHELAHFSGSDTRFSKRFYPVYRGTESSLGHLEASIGVGAGAVMLIPAIIVLGYFLECFSKAESRLGRERELNADKAGASVLDAATMSAALVKVHAFADCWPVVQAQFAQSVSNGSEVSNVSHQYADAVRAHATPAAFDDIADTHVPHPTDSHPTLAARLASLETRLSDVATRALDVAPLDAAVTVIDRFEEVELALSDALRSNLVGAARSAQPLAAAALAGDGPC